MQRVLLMFLVLLPSFLHAAMTATPPKPRRGDVVRLHFAVAAQAPPRILFEGLSYPAWPAEGGGWEGLVAVDRDAKPGKKRVALVDENGAALTERELRVEDRAFAEQRLSVEERTVTLSPQDQERAAREKERIDAALVSLTASRLWRSAFSRPVEGEISSPFGLKRFYNGKARNYHGGIDIAAGKGTPVRAASEGVVLLAGDFFFTGYSVFVDHGLGLVTAYFHMDDLAVAEGEPVGPGTVLGHVGSTGRSTGPHLHWSTYLLARKADPDALIRATASPGGPEKP